MQSAAEEHMCLSAAHCLTSRPHAPATLNPPHTQEFIEWWNNNSSNDFSKKLHQMNTMTAESEVAIDKLLMSDKDRKALTSTAK